MLLYLSSNGKSDLLDFLEEKKAESAKRELIIKKLVGRFTLKQFVVKDMRNYLACKFFVIDMCCVNDLLEDFIIAMKSFQMMFNARIIVVLSGTKNESDYIDKLIEIGVTEIVTSTAVETLEEEILECLSKDGMERYKPKKESPKFEVKPVKPINTSTNEVQIPKYKWNAKNVRIAVIGTSRRSGVTVTAFNFANWLIARGATACYVEMNMNRHLHYLIERYTLEKSGEHYPVGDVDCFLTSEIDKNYNFIIYDLGTVNELPSLFRDAELRLICGSLLPYEELDYSKLLHQCEGLSAFKMALAVPAEFQIDCQSTFGEDLLIADASHDLFNDNINGHIYLPMAKNYIVPERKL